MKLITRPVLTVERLAKFCEANELGFYLARDVQPDLVLYEIEIWNLVTPGMFAEAVAPTLDEALNKAVDQLYDHRRQGFIFKELETA